MIAFTKSYKTTDGQVFSSIEEAQVHELVEFMNEKKFVNNPSEVIAKFILDNKVSIMDILTTTPNSRPKGRAIHGGTKKRSPKAVVADPNSVNVIHDAL